MELDFNKLEQRIIDSKIADPFISAYHYSGKLGHTMLSLGYYYDNVLIGAITYGVGASPQQIKWLNQIEPSWTQQNFFELTRLCIHPDWHIKNLASVMVGKSFDYLRKNMPERQVLVSYADTNQVNSNGINHIGYIYQATNWYFVGTGGRLTQCLLDGVEKHSKTYLTNKDKKSLYELKSIAAKQKYLFFLANKKLKKEWLKKITILPYPKQNNLVGVRAEDFFKKEKVQKVLIDRDLTKDKSCGIVLNAVEVSKDTPLSKGEGLVRLQDSALILPEPLPSKQPTKLLITEEDSTHFNSLLSELATSQHWSFDVETDGAHFVLAKLDGIGFYFPSEKSYYVNLYKTSDKWIETVIESLRPHFENEKTGKIGFNILYDAHVMKNYGVDVKGPICDAMIESYLVNPADRPFKLKTLVPKHLKIEMRQYKEIDRENILDMATYCMEDSRCTYLLYKNRKEELIKHSMWRLFCDIEMPFLKVLFDMERRGIKVDIERLTLMHRIISRGMNNYKRMFYKRTFGNESEAVLIKVAKKIKGETKRIDEQFNIDSTQHLGTLLYKDKKYPVLSKTPKGKPSTDRMALEILAERGYEGMAELVKYRKMQKLLTGFIEPILNEHLINGRVYPSYLQHGTGTGRLSSSKPNFQNLPVRTIHGKALRRCFVANDGCKLIDADLSQIELRVMAHYSQDPQLVRAFQENLDLHDLTSQLVFGYPPQFTDEKLHPENKSVRTLCKNLNFGLQYGAGPRKFALMANLELKENRLTEEQAKEYIERYFKKYSMVKTFQLAYPQEVRRLGYATTILGRRRYLPEIQKKPYSGDKVIDKENWKKTSHAERQAISTVIQGTASDILKLAMLRAYRKGLLLVTQIHDQVLVLSKKETADKDVEVLRDCLENCGIKLEVPVIAKIKVVDRWEQESDSAPIEEEKPFED